MIFYMNHFNICIQLSYGYFVLVGLILVFEYRVDILY